MVAYLFRKSNVVEVPPLRATATEAAGLKAKADPEE